MFARKKLEVGEEGGREQLWDTLARSLDQASIRKGEKECKMGRSGLKRGESGAYYKYSFSHSGSFRKPADHVVGTRRWLIRLWAVVVVLITLCLLASSLFGNSIQATIFHTRKPVFSNPDGSGSSSRRLWDSRTEQMFTFSFNALRNYQIGDGSKPRSLTSTLTSDEQRNIAADGAATIVTATPFIEDLVSLPENLDLFIVSHGFSVFERISACDYGGSLKSVPRIVDFLFDQRLAVTCTRPTALRTQRTLNAGNVSLELDDGVVDPVLPHPDATLKPVRWDESLVYAIQTTDLDVILYVKKVFNSGKGKAEEYVELENFRCQFGDAVVTPVLAGAQEVFRCAIPRVKHLTDRVKVHLLYKGKSIPSIAYYEPQRGDSIIPTNLKVGPWRFGRAAVNIPPKKKYFVCSCTLTWNVAKFLKEWVLYNSDLGVEKFFLYDNNSEDDIRRVVSELSEYNVTRRTWPWVKTQEAGFSHCAVEAQRECTWILFTDVDEYLFPKRWLQIVEPEEEGPAEEGLEERATAITTLRSDKSPLESLIEDISTRVTLPAGKTSKRGKQNSVKGPSRQEVGQISFQCRNFGPTGLTAHPSNGVTQGYTCREDHVQRHKSLVYFPALKSSMRNVIHHFYLKPEFQTVYLDVRKAVVNHYKFQAWREFEPKFTKRASTYVVDWKEPKNLNSRDRPEGLGNMATKPEDWENRFCDRNDTALRDYTRARFGVLEGGESLKMAWEL